MSLESFARETILRQVPGAKHKGFMDAWIEIKWAELLQYFAERPEEENKWTLPEFVEYEKGHRPPFRADMYYIDAEEHLLYFYEIEDTHPLTKEKLEQVQDWFEAVGNEDGSYGRLIVTDRYGRNHRMIFAYENTFGPEPVKDDEIEHRFPKQYAPLD